MVSKTEGFWVLFTSLPASWLLLMTATLREARRKVVSKWQLTYQLTLLPNHFIATCKKQNNSSLLLNDLKMTLVSYHRWDNFTESQRDWKFRLRSKSILVTLWYTMAFVGARQLIIWLLENIWGTNIAFLR